MKLIYWSSTILICAFLLLSAYTYIFHQSTIEGVKALGFPDFFRIELAALKVVALIVILLPGIPGQAKGWAYSGVMLFLLTAFVSHAVHHDSVGLLILLIVLSAITITSYFTLNKQPKKHKLMSLPPNSIGEKLNSNNFGIAFSSRLNS